MAETFPSPAVGVGNVVQVSLQLVGEATRIRDLAKQARRVASTLTRELDRKRLLRHADELEECADLLLAGVPHRPGFNRSVGKQTEEIR